MKMNKFVEVGQVWRHKNNTLRVKITKRQENDQWDTAVVDVIKHDWSLGDAWTTTQWQINRFWILDICSTVANIKKARLI